MRESDLQVMVADYLRLQYPNVLFHSDFGSGIKLTKGQAIKQKRQNGGMRGYPDMVILEPRKKVISSDEVTRDEVTSSRDKHTITYVYMKNHCGLFLELKKEGTRLKKKDGTWATEHIAEQANYLQALRDRGYDAHFAVGFEQAKEIIDSYLS